MFISSIKYFFENEEGDNLSTILSNINENIQVQNKILNHIAQTFPNMQMRIGGGDESDNESDHVVSKKMIINQNLKFY